MPAGWTLSSATCSEGSPVSAIAISPGETTLCTFNNTLQPPPAVGGIAGLLDSTDSAPMADAQSNRGANPLALGGISSLMLLVGVAWILGRRVLH